MFDVSFTELLVVGVVALIVIGPERLPKVARTIGHLVGRAQRYVNDVKSDINREMELDELRNLRAEMEEAARTLETTVKNNVGDMKQGFDDAQKNLDRIAQDVKATANDAVKSVDAAVAAASVPAAALAAEPLPAAIAAAPAATASETAASGDANTQAAEPPADAVETAQPSLFPVDALPPVVNAPDDDLVARAARTPEKS